MALLPCPGGLSRLDDLNARRRMEGEQRGRDRHVQLFVRKCEIELGLILPGDAYAKNFAVGSSQKFHPGIRQVLRLRFRGNPDLVSRSTALRVGLERLEL